MSEAALPVPDADARAHSARVVAHIRDEIARANGWIPFERYMALALYAPGLGYYVAGARRFGEAGDFVTGPELSPLYGFALARQVAAIFDAGAPREIVEFGAGSGALAVSLLAALAGNDALPSRYRIVEVSPSLREAQRSRIAARAPDMLGRVEWIERLPPAIDGAVVMNEVLDAIAPRFVERREGAWLERGVTWRDGAFAWQSHPVADASVEALARERFPADGDYASELNPAAAALVTSVGRRIASGALLVIDYGFPRHEYYHPQRHGGTLVGHYRHRVHADPFLWPGLSDLTSHVDFTAIAEAGVRAGLRVAGFATQASLLLGCGILDRLREVGAPESVDYLRAASAVQRLLSPAEMGELFKGLLLARGEVRSLALRDQSQRL